MEGQSLVFSLENLSLIKNFKNYRDRVEAMTKLTFYGGVGEIGGNKILLEEKDARIFLDFGMSFTLAEKFFSEFLQPRKCNGVGDLIEFNLLPDIEGLYREDYLQDKKKREEVKYDAIILSHAHGDHAAYIHYIRKEIPIYCSLITRQILKALEITSSSGFSDFLHLKENFKLIESKKGRLRWAKGAESKVERPFKILKEENFIKCFKIKSLPVCHSLPGALGFIIEGKNVSIVYTGDFRFHGYSGELTREFIEEMIKNKPEIMICEGTRIEEKENTLLTEEELKNKVSKIIKETQGLVVVNFPIRDIDRMISFFEAARENNRKLVINSKQAYLLNLLREVDPALPQLGEVAVYLSRKRKGVITDPSYPDYLVQQDYELWEQEFLHHPAAVTFKDIRDNPSFFLFRCDFFELKELIDIRPPRGSCYIRSITEPFDEEMMIEKKRADNWLKHFGLYPYHQIHCSGHASGGEIQEMVNMVKPKILIPVHTEKPHLFRNFHKRVKIVSPGETLKF